MNIYSNIKYLGGAEFCILPTVNDKNVATQDWVNSQIESITGTNLQNYVTCSFLLESLASYATSESLACVFTELSESIEENNTNSITCSKAYTDKCIEDLNISQYATIDDITEGIKTNVPKVININNTEAITAGSSKEFSVTGLEDYNKIPLIQVYDKNGDAILIDVNFNSSTKKVKLTSSVSIDANDLTIVIFAY